MTTWALPCLLCSPPASDDRSPGHTERLCLTGDTERSSHLCLCAFVLVCASTSRTYFNLGPSVWWKEQYQIPILIFFQWSCFCLTSSSSEISLGKTQNMKITGCDFNGCFALSSVITVTSWSLDIRVGCQATSGDSRQTRLAYLMSSSFSFIFLPWEWCPFSNSQKQRE